MTPEQHAEAYRAGRGEQHLDALVNLAKGGQGISADTMAEMVRRACRMAESAMNEDDGDRQLILESLIRDLQRLVGPGPTHATVVLFKRSGKFYTEEAWAIPDGAIGPWDMERSPDFHRIDAGPVLVPEQEPFGYPILL